MNHKDPSTWKTTSSQYGYYKLNKKEVLGYSSIDFAMNLVFQCIALYISYFYTDIFGLKPGHVAIIFAVSRIWDAINDPMMGTICERLQPKKGKYWIYIRWGAIPFGLAAIMTYTTPNFSYGMKVVWAVVGYNLLNMLYTFIIQPYISAATLMTNDQHERTRLQSIRMTLAQAGGVVCAIMLPELSNFFSEGMGMTLAQGYMLTTVIMAIIMVAILLWGSSQIVERIPAPPIDPNNKASVKDVFYLLFRVGPVFVTFVLFLGVYTMSQVQSTMGAYYINYYANRSDMLSWFSMIMMLFSVIGVPCVPYLTKRLHKKGTVMFGLAVAGIGCLLLPHADHGDHWYDDLPRHHRLRLRRADGHLLVGHHRPGRIRRLEDRQALHGHRYDAGWPGHQVLHDRWRLAADRGSGSNRLCRQPGTK